MEKSASQAKRQLTAEELSAHLAEQLGFLENSCDAFDKGHEGEAKRLALTIRVLLHVTKNSKGLLGQIGNASTNFVNTAEPLFPDNLAPHNGLVYTSITRGEAAPRYVAMLDETATRTVTPFDEWWNQPVFKDNSSAVLSRKQLVLIAADQDGGAHVDPSLDDFYYRLSHENALGLHYGTTAEQGLPMPSPIKAAIRQIAHEVLKTLKPGYAKIPTNTGDVIIGQMFAVFGGTENLPKNVPPRKMKRNETCWCNSGRKYKHCHGKI